MKVLTWGYKFTREIARRMPHFRGEPAAVHPPFAPGGPASIVPHAEGPVAFDTPRIEYSEEDELALEAYARAAGGCEISLSYDIFSQFATPRIYSEHDLACGEFSLSSNLVEAVMFAMTNVYIPGPTFFLALRYDSLVLAL